MEPVHVRLLIVVALVVLVSVATSDRRVAMAGAQAPVAAEVETVPEAAPVSDEARAAEVARVRAHLVRVEQELLSASVAHLTTSQRENRARHIEVLREYRERAIFPHNHQVLGRRVPVFIDGHGTHCAVGYLIARSGHGDLARRIADERNLAAVPELADIPELVAWLDANGLSLDEAARIQPAYDWMNPDPQGDAGYGVATAVIFALGATSGVWNVVGDRTSSGWWVPGALGVASGAAGATLALLGPSLEDNRVEIESSHIAINAGIGLISGLLGVRTLRLGRAAPATVGDRPEPPQAPTLNLSAWAPADGGVGARVGITF